MRTSFLSQKKHRIGAVSKKFTGGLKHVINSTNLNLSFDVDRDT